MNKPYHLLIVGPMPPPLTGTPVSFQLFVEEAQKSDALSHLNIIDASPRYLKQVTGTGLSFSRSNISQAWRIIWDFIQKAPKADRIILFGSNGFAISLAPILLTIAKLMRKPCYLRIFGGSLDQFVVKIPFFFRYLLYFTLRRVDGLIVQTKLLYDYFLPYLGEKKLYILAGYRSSEFRTYAPKNYVEPFHKPFRLAYFGIIKEEKGVFVLLESMQKLQEESDIQVLCDLYGSIPAEIESRFLHTLSQVEGVHFKGVLEWDKVIPTLSTYDALVHPTFYQGEGQPGVLIETMMAGIPAISTEFRSIPEVITDGDNGLLVPPGDTTALADAISRLYRDHKLYNRLAEKNWNMQKNYDASCLVPSILKQINESSNDSVFSELQSDSTYF